MSGSEKAIWENIDKHREELSGIKKDMHGISERMLVLENRFEYSIENQAKGQARIETMLEGLQSDVTKLNEQKLLTKGYEDAKKEQSKLYKWAVGILIAVSSSGWVTWFFGGKG